MKRVIEGIALLLFVIFFAAGLRPESSEYDIDGFAHLPMMDEGRRKPIDTFARNLLTVLSGKSSVHTEVGERLSANEWLLDTLAGREAALDYRVIRITQLDLLHQLGLEKRARFRYSYREVMPALPALEQAAQAAGKKDSRDRDLYDREAIKLASRLALFQTSLSAFEDPRLIPSDQLFSAIQRYMNLEKRSIPLVVPPLQEEAGWRPLMSSLSAAHPAMLGLAALWAAAYGTHVIWPCDRA